jgi:signal transduction histidine kinase
MSVSLKLFLILVFVALVPLGVFAFTALREHEHALDSELTALHRKTAEHGARSTEQAVDSALHTVRGLAAAIPWGELSDEERGGALLLVYEQLDDVAVASLLDGRGAGIGASIYRDRAGDPHPRVSTRMLAGFAGAIPLGPARTAPTFGDPVVLAGGEAFVPIAVPVSGTAGATWVLAIALSLRGTCRELAMSTPPGVSTYLEANGRVLCGGPTHGDNLTASVRLAQGWTVVVEQPKATAFASLERVRRQSMLWLGVGVAGALIAGLVLTQAIRRPLRQLAAGAEIVATGNLDHRVTIKSRDEFGAVARSFNRMSGEIAKQNAEIRAWNDELQQRVDARTAELKQAQEQLLESRKLGAIAVLGAGVAHEINNPLTGVVGLTQLLLAKRDKLDDKTVKNLTSIEREALRIRDIVDRLSSLAQDSVGDARRLDLIEVVDAAANQHAQQLAASKIEVERSFASSIPAVLGNASQLQHAIGQLVDNSLRAMPSGGRLRLAVRSIEGELVAIEVEDTGRGIAPDVIDKIFEPFFTTKDNWQGAGLGLAVAHRIVAAHQGRIRVSSKLGSGTTMTVTLPAARRAAHLV